MALTYYIRSWDPRSTYPTNPQEGDICYTITLDQTWAPVGGVKDDNILKKEVYQNGAWVEQGGGGGGYKVVSVTLTADSFVEIYPGQNGSAFDSVFVSNTGFEASMFFDNRAGYDEVTENMVLFGDSASCTISGTFVSATGDATWDPDNSVLVISGDCSVTLSS